MNKQKPIRADVEKRSTLIIEYTLIIYIYNIIIDSVSKSNIIITYTNKTCDISV